VVGGALVLIWAAPYKPDYDKQMSDRCFNYGLRASAAPYPASSLQPIGKPADLRQVKYTVNNPATSQKSVAGRHAHGTFLSVNIDVQSIVPYDTGFLAEDFQLIDRTGAAHCAAQYTSALASIPVSGNTPEDVKFPMMLDLHPDSSAITINIVFDIDPILVQGAYLLAWDVAGGKASFDLGM